MDNATVWQVLRFLGGLLVLSGSYAGVLALMNRLEVRWARMATAARAARRERLMASHPPMEPHWFMVVIEDTEGPGVYYRTGSVPGAEPELPQVQAAAEKWLLEAVRQGFAAPRIRLVQVWDEGAGQWREKSFVTAVREDRLEVWP